MTRANELVTVFGGSGFVGRYVVRALARRGYRVRAAVRRPDLAFHLQPLGNVGQIHAVQANLRYPQSVAAAVAGSDAVVNCVGILSEGGRQTFDAVQAFGAGAIARAAAGEGISRVAHVSAIGADRDLESNYARTKGLGEAAVMEAVPSAVILRPSIVFGQEDGFFNKFASMARFSPVLPLIGCGLTKFQPVYVNDVAEAVARAVDGEVPAGSVQELGGPRVASFKDLLELMLTETAHKRLLVPLPFPLASFIGSAVGWLPGAPITADQVKLLRHDNVVTDAAIAEGRTLEGMGIEPVAMETILPTYLTRYRKAGQFTPEPGR